MATYLLSKPEEGYADKLRESGALYKGPAQGASGNAGKLIFTANGAGSTTTLVGVAASLAASTNVARLGERFVLVNSAGVLKEPTIFTVTVHNGTTTITFTPAAAVATASGDKAMSVSVEPYADNDSLDAVLLASGAPYTQLYIDKLSQNDKIYAVRQLSLPDAVK